jgi:RNA polymerase sigma factor (TIGR02999 family)
VGIDIKYAPEPPMSNVTRILSAIEQGDGQAAEELLPLVYDELRKLAAAKLAHEKPGQTLQATALVHEAYIRLIDTETAQHWDSRGHFFAAAAEAMRRILIDNARRKRRPKHGGDRHRIDFDTAFPATYATIDLPIFELLSEVLRALRHIDFNRRFDSGLPICPEIQPGRKWRTA